MNSSKIESLMSTLDMDQLMLLTEALCEENAEREEELRREGWQEGYDAAKEVWYLAGYHWGFREADHGYTHSISGWQGVTVSFPSDYWEWEWRPVSHDELIRGK